MLHKEDKKKVEQIQMIAPDQLVSADHLSFYGRMGL